MMSKQLLIETFEPSAFEIVESRQGTGKMVARGEFGRVDVPTQNGRIYTRRLMEREIERLGEKLKSRRVTGQLDHPSDGRSSLEKVSHVITDLWIEKDGRVMGEAEIIAGTPAGKTLKALIEAGIPVGVSSRGFGSTKPVVGEMEGDEVQDDFVLRTYDFVEDPAVKTAFPKVAMESVEDQKEDNLAEMFLNEFPDIAKALKEDAVKDAVEKAKDRVVTDVENAVSIAESRVRREMTEAFEKRLAASLIAVREDARATLKEEFGSDPEIGAAKATLAQIAEIVGAYRVHPDEAAVRDALKAKEIEIAERTRERDEAVDAGERAALLLHVERKIGGHKMANSIRKLMANARLESVQDADSKLEAIVADFPVEDDDDEPDGPTENEVRLREDNATLRGELKLLQERVANLDERLKRAVELGQRVNGHLKEAETRAEAAEERIGEMEKELHEANLSAYKASKVVGMANGGAVLNLLEGVNSEDAVDKIVSSRGVFDVADGELREMRRKLQRGSGDTREELSENRSQGRSKENETNEFGMPISEMLQLAGIR